MRIQQSQMRYCSKKLDINFLSKIVFYLERIYTSE